MQLRGDPLSPGAPLGLFFLTLLSLFWARLLLYLVILLLWLVVQVEIFYSGGRRGVSMLRWGGSSPAPPAPQCMPNPNKLPS